MHEIIRVKTPCHSHRAQSCSTVVGFALTITAQGGSTASWGTAHAVAAACRWWTQLPWCQQHSSTGTGSSLTAQLFAAHWVTGWGKSRMHPEFHLDYSKQHGCSTEYLYCHKSYGILFYLPKTHAISSDKKSFTHSWDFTAKPTRMSENYAHT